MYHTGKEQMKRISAYAGLRADYVQGGGGNTSVKFDDHLMAIKASGYTLADITEEKGYVTVEYPRIQEYYNAVDTDIQKDYEKESLEVNLSSMSLLPGMENKRPSVEVGFHSFLQTCVIHTHSVYATTLACLHWEIPAVHYLVGFAGPKVPVAPYATYGTDDLARNVWQTMGPDYQAVLLANHGLVAVGANLPKALDTAEEIEFVARVFCQAKSIGDPACLDDAEMERVMEKFKSYGRQDVDPES